jgi:anthranilate synthase component 1
MSVECLAPVADCGVDVLNGWRAAAERTEAATSGGPSYAPGLAIEPSLGAVRDLARDYRLVPLRHSFIDDCETPVSAFLKLRARQADSPAFLLESAEQGQRMGRYSFIGLRPHSVLRWSLGDAGDPYALAAQAVADHQQAHLPDLPPFAGGAVGYFGYDLVRTVEPLGAPNPDPVGLPDMALMLSDVLVVFDHVKHTISILANVDAAGGNIDASYADAVAAIREVRELLAAHVPRPRADGSAKGRSARRVPEFTSNVTQQQFEAMVSQINEYIHAGDAFQVVPSQRWSAELHGTDPFSIYRGLRVVNPSPYMYFLDYGDFQVVGASPEPLVTVHGRRVCTRPIAGTRPRGADGDEDILIAEGLLQDEKERAEHLMLVDLGRNDLGRVCEYGSVRVETFMEIESYSHVMHIVSSVSGTLCEGIGPMDALRSVLPGGTLSGAPKVRAMQIIDELEPVKRGGYGGAIGYLSYTGDLDTCIHIRTVVVKDGTAHIQAGGGTVADARPECEYEESVAKSRAVRSAVELAARQPDWE